MGSVLAVGLFTRSAPPGQPIDSPRGARLRTATDGRDVLLNTPDGWEQDQPWLWWQGPAGSDGTGGPFGSPLSTDDPTGFSTLPAVSYCTSLIVDTIAGMPWQVIRGEYERLPTPDWISDPQALRADARIVDSDLLTAIRLSAV